jgi:DNA-binding NtrC family response regulator
MPEGCHHSIWGCCLLERAQIRVLLVEVDDAFRRNISERLYLEGSTVFEADNEAEARTIITTNGEIDVVLVGIRAVKERGLPRLRFMKKARPLVEVILMTPSEEHSLYVSIKAMKLGAFDDLMMPFDVKTLLDRIHAANQLKKQKKEAMREGSGN